MDNTPEEPVIHAQRGALAGRPATPEGGEQKPILAPWMKYRAEFTGKVRDVGQASRAYRRVAPMARPAERPSRAVVCPTRALEDHPVGAVSNSPPSPRWL